MTKELSAEEIVTKLLTNHQILKCNKDNFYMSNPRSLGDYLKNLPKEDIKEPSEKSKGSRYSFINY